jgi:GDP-L-fucose synthase
MKKNILVFGSGGLVGSAVSRLVNKKYLEKFSIFSATRKDANLFSLSETIDLIEKVKPDVVINAAAKVGGIVANNTERTEFILENLKININILESIVKYPNIKLINLGSSCIYPLNAKNPIQEISLMTGKLEPTNSPYAMAKLTAIEIGDALKKQYGHSVINLMPTNLYGPNDNFSPNKSHVIPGLMYRMELAKKNKLDKFEVWGTGTPRREFLHVDDLAEAIIFIILKNIEESVLNIGSSKEVTISELAETIKDTVSYKGSIIFDKSKPDGNPQKLLDSDKIRSFGWEPKIELKEGIKSTYNWFTENIEIN